ncbi:MAG: hypothetical protein J5522_06645, partial [Lachnospiraceae bacterium]|nr:hypothetical protein [Lachnospiraceae bacterium]
KGEQAEKPIPCQMINCFCMFSDYVPLTLTEWIKVDEERRKKMNAGESAVTGTTGMPETDI